MPLSVAADLSQAFREWYLTGNTIDYEEPVETCQLCSQEDLRYHFEIQNAETNRTLWVGSQCILKFGVAVYDDGRALDRHRAERKLKSMMDEMRLQSCLKALQRVANEENSDILSAALKFYSQREYLTPRFAFVVLWRLGYHAIDHSPSFFKVSLRRSKYQHDLREMPLSQVHVIWPALSSAQRRKAVQMGHTPPPPR